MLKTNIADKNGIVADVDCCDDVSGLVVATRQLKEYTTKTAFFTNSTHGREMAQNGAYGAVAWVLHDGTDTTEADSGTADTDTANHVIQSGQNFASTVCVGMTVHNTDDNSYAEVTVVADTDLTCDADVCPDGDEAYTVGPAWTFSEVTGTKWIEDSTTQYHDGSKSLSCTNAAVGDIMQLQNVNGEDIVLTSQFVAITMWVYVGGSWGAGDSVSLYARLGVDQVGNKIYLEDYFPYGTTAQWHYINIPLADMGLTSSTIDSFRFENEARDGPLSPTFYLDEITLQASGSIIDFIVEPDKGTWFHIKAFQTTFVDAVTADNADSTMSQLSYDQILAVSPTEGYTYKRYSGGESDPVFEARITSLLDLLSFPYSKITNAISDGTNTLITIENTYPTGVAFVLKAEDLDRLVFSIEDDFSGLLYFRICVQGYVEQR